MVRLIKKLELGGVSMARVFLLLFFVFQVGVVSVFATQLEPKQTASFYFKPFLQKVSQDSIYIVWNNWGLCKAKVEWGKGALTNSIQVSKEKSRHEAQITGLEPNTVYNYKVSISGLLCDNDSFSSTFMTAPPADKPFTFLVYGDTRRGIEQIIPKLPVIEDYFGTTGEGGTNAAHQYVINGMLSENPRLVVFVGDAGLIGTQGTVIGEEEFYNWFKIEAPLLSQSVFIPSYGNHEGDLLTGQIDYNLSLFDEYFVTYANNPNNDETYYSFDYGNSRFIVLNTNQGGDILKSGKPQRSFLESELSKASSDKAQGKINHIFLFFHIPIHPSSSGGFFAMPSNVYTEVHNLFKTHKVDIVFQGHIHTYERHYYDGLTYIITGGGGAPISGGANDADTKSFYQTLHYLSVTVWGDKIDVMAKRPDGTVLDYFANYSDSGSGSSGSGGTGGGGGGEDKDKDKKEGPQAGCSINSTYISPLILFVLSLIFMKVRKRKVL